MGSNETKYVVCTCPFCKESFAAEVSVGSIELKTFSQDHKTEPVKPIM